jgi:hypothetical protein
VARVLACGFCLVAGPLGAATTQTLGAGSAVAIPERLATFDSLNSTNPQELGNYAEGGLLITTGNQSWAADPPLAARLDPFHGATAPDRGFFCVAWENLDWTSIRATNRQVIHGVEFVYGNSWTTGAIFGQYPWGSSDADLVWETWRDGTNISSGSVPFLAVGSIVGFYDPAGFDELLMKAISTASADTNLNALALDNVSAMLTNVPPAPLVYGSDLAVNPATGVPSLTVWATIPGVAYRLVYSEDLGAGLWSPVTPPSPAGWVPGGGDLTLSDPGAPGRPRRFYRVEAR